jgi:hypothetical protein
VKRRVVVTGLGAITPIGSGSRGLYEWAAWKDGGGAADGRCRAASAVAQEVNPCAAGMPMLPEALAERTRVR